ncbi:MAG: cyclic nucleotide-binding domain-containing protein [Candidatus Eremiobacteraeota bacterium]|nr:cyclic nucleotide-binding domain-containing protein [Candidatus Eremiobacteraeota bacterium]
MHNGSPRRALVLSGGGARGAYEAGVVTALCEREDFDIVCGTSIGAINAALTAQGATSRLREIWRGVPERAMIRGITPLGEFWNVLARRDAAGRRTLRELAVDVARGIAALRHARSLRQMTHVLDPAPLVAMLSSVLDFGALERTLVVGVTNLTLARPEAFYSFPEGDVERERAFANRESASVRLSAQNYVTSILASAAIPLAFPKVPIAGPGGVVCDYVDGGIGNNTPIRQAIDAGADEITVVIADHVALRDRTHRIDDLGSIALVAQDILQQQVLELDLKLTRRVNEAVLHGTAPGKRFVRIRTIGPSVAIPLPILGFANLATIDRAFDQGLADGRGACDASGLSRLFATDPSARAVRAGEVVVDEGDVGSEMFVVLEGEFELSFQCRAIGVLGAGDIFGELALLGSGPRRAGVVATKDGVVVPVDRDRFRYLVQYAPSFALIVLRSLAALLRDMNDTGGISVVDPLDVSGATAGEPSHLDVFRNDAAIQTYAAGDAIFAAGDAGDAMYVVVDGRVDVHRHADGSVVTALAGDVFGEMALGDDEPRSAAATATTDARVVPVDGLRFTSLVQNNPNFAIEVMRKMAERMLSQVDAIVDANRP